MLKIFKNKGVLYGGAFCTIVLALFVAFNESFAHADSQVDFSLNVSETVIEIRLSPQGAVSLDLAPVDDGVSFASKDITVTVGTNNSTGYSLSMATGGNTTVLTRTEFLADGVTKPTISAIPAGGFTENTFKSSDSTVNKWGFMVTKSDTTTTDYLPFAGSSIALWSSNGPANGEDTIITFAAKVNNLQPSGTYTTTVNFTAVANAPSS